MPDSCCAVRVDWSVLDRMPKLLPVDKASNFMSLLIVAHGTCWENRAMLNDAIGLAFCLCVVCLFVVCFLLS